MDSKLERFLNKIGFPIDDQFINMKITKVVVNKNTSEWDIDLLLKKIIDFSLLEKLYKCAIKGIDDVKRINLNFKYENITDDDIKELIGNLFNESIVKDPALNCLSKDDFHIEDNFIVFEVSNRMEQNLLNELSIIWLEEMNKFGISNYQIEIHINEEKHRHLIEEISDVPEYEFIPPVKEEKNADIVIGDEITNEPIIIKELVKPKRSVVVEAAIISLNVINTKKADLTIVSLKIGDETGRFSCKIFAKSKSELEELEKLLVNGWYKIKGSVKLDEFAGELTLMANSIVKIPDKEVKIKEEEKIPVVIDENSPLILGRDFTGDVTTIKNIAGPENNVILEVFVFGLEIVNTSKENLKIATLKISDKTDSLIGKIFSRNDEDIAKIKRISVGSWYRMRGHVKDDAYSKDIVLNITDILSIPSKDVKRMDNSEEKRVELHCHTMMSQMDGVADVNKLLGTASKWGHKALAITDHNVLQAFPDAFNSKKKGDVKVIYGVEMNVIDDKVNIVVNPDNRQLNDQEFVVFDTETTGFNPTNGDQIIEIGAVKIKDGEILSSFDELISPEKELPEKITELTGITKDMLIGKDNEEVVTKKFLEFLGDLPLVAHNALFDLSFLASSMRKYNLGEFKNPLLDTMEISRILSPDERRHSLSALVKRYNVEFDESSHHRADYDAKGTALIFEKMVKLLKRMDILTINDLQNKVDIKEMLKFARPFHMTILAMNPVGLKNLFRIESYASTKYLKEYGTVRIARSDLIKNREGLLFGSGCVNGEIFNEARRKDDSELSNLMSFYDYIEVQPPEISKYLIDTSEFTNIIELENNIRKIIRVAESSNIPVVATGDVHQVDPEDRIYREIIINQKTPNLGMHPLKKNDIKEIPNMYFRTTEEMINDFSFLNDDELVKKIVITNTNMIADKIEPLTIIKDKLYTPVMPNSDEETKTMCYTNAHKMYGDPLPPIVEERLDKELSGIISNGYSVLYLIAQRLVHKSNEDGYFVGSRGSVGSSFVATMMDITEVNGLPPHYLCPNENCKFSIWNDEKGEGFALNYASGYDLPDYVCPKCGTKMRKEGQEIPFATFLGFQAEKVPDIDLNFSGDNQPDAHNYTKVLFGEDKVYRAGTIGTVADKTAYGFVKGYIEDKGITMRSAEIERLSTGCIGVKRTTGQHPGGIIVIPDYLDVFDFTAYQYPADDPNNSWYTTHFDFHAIHDNVLKLDILGHDDPTMLKYFGDRTGIDIKTLPFDDKDVLSLFKSPQSLGITSEDINCFSGTLGIPEFGTNFSIKMLEETRPESFAELVKISGLSHGTDVWAGNARDLILNNVVPFKEVIGCRDDILNTLMNYGMDPSHAFKISEFVRKGKASADPAKWSEYVKDLEAANVPEWFITSCSKIKYMFPKAHATAYVMMALRVAWFKVHMPLYYYSAFLSIRCADFDVEAMAAGKEAVKAKIEEINAKGFGASNKEANVLITLNICLEMLCRGFTFEQIDIAKSDAKYFLINEEKKTLLIPFKALDGLGDSVAYKVIEEREKMPFMSIEDVQNRGKINGTTIDKLRLLGSFKDLPESSQLSLF